ncbi:MAG: hypothetical protein AB7N76_16105 [Planctomycetota bacterium]
MSDARLRELERQALTDPEARAAWLAEQLRRQAISRERLELAALLGEPTVCAALARPARRLEPETCRRLAPYGPEATCRVGVALAAAVAGHDGPLPPLVAVLRATVERRGHPELQRIKAAVEHAGSLLRTRNDPAATAVRTAGQALLVEPRPSAVWQAWYVARCCAAALRVSLDEPLDDAVRQDVVPWVLGLGEE